MSLGDLTKLFGQVKELQGKAEALQKELAARHFEAASGGGMVTATVNGKSELLKLRIDPTAVDINDVEMLEDLVIAAVNAAVQKSQEQMKEEMSKMAGGLNIPGLDQLNQFM